MPKYTYGRKKVTIPLGKNDLTQENIQKYLPKALKIHAVNASDYKRLEAIVRGEGQSILSKKRESQEVGNHIILENHALSMVKFKQGYMYGTDVKYSQSGDIDTSEELKALINYFEDIEKGSLDNEMAFSLYVCGVANRLVLPSGATGNTEETPFYIYNLPYESSFVAYSAGYTQEKLFGVIVSQLDEDFDEVLVYTHNEVFAFTKAHKELGGTGDEELVYSSTTPHVIGHVPIVEYTIGQDRMGIQEIVESMLDGVNSISSDCVDNVSDYVNALFFVKNMRIDQEEIAKINTTRAIELLTTDPSRPADAGYITNKLDLSDVQGKYDSLLASAYDIVGVPHTQQVTSGGDTGEARMLGGGWTRAEVVASQEEKSLVKGEKELLKIVISICSKISSTNIKNLRTRDVKIVFTRNMNTNMLVKTQSLATLISMHMPKEQALNIVQLTSNPHEVAIAWEEKSQKEKEEERASGKTKGNKFAQSAGTPLDPSNAPTYQ